MTDATRRRLIDLSVVTVAALVVAAGALIVADVDGQKAHVPTLVLSVSESGALEAAQAPQTPPVPGLQPAPRPARRIVYLRQTRAS